MKSKNYQVSGQLLSRTKGSGHYEINFNVAILNVLEEVRALEDLGFTSPVEINLTSRKGKALYPYATKLKTTLDNYYQLDAKLR